MRLPSSVAPVRYRVRLVPFLEPGNFTIRGEVDIELRCDENTDVIKMHALDMDIDFGTTKVRRKMSLMTQIKCRFLAHKPG